MRAIANGFPVAVCNRVGFEPDPFGQTAGAQFWGGSFVVDPKANGSASLRPTSRPRWRWSWI